MARHDEIIPAIRRIGLWQFIMRINQRVEDDGIFAWASALAYSWLFAVFPFMLFLLSLVPYLPQSARGDAQRFTASSVEQLLGKAAPTINDNIAIALRHPRQGWLGISLICALWVASGGMSMTMAALDQCYEIKKRRLYWRQRSVAIALTISTAAMILTVLVFLPAGDTMSRWIFLHWASSRRIIWSLNAARYALAVLLMLSVLGVIYYFGPSLRTRFHPLSPGALFCIVVWLLLDFAFRIYVDRFARFDQTYGTVGGVAMLLLFFYIDALVLLIGAEINAEIDCIIHLEPRKTHS